MKKHSLATQIIFKEMSKVAGEMYTRQAVEHNEEEKKKIEAMEFMEELLNGTFKTKNNHLSPYVDKYNNLLESFLLLSEESEK